MDEDEILDGEMVEFGEDERPSVVDTEDGGAVVYLDEDEAEEGEFYANLAEDMEGHELRSLANTLVELIDRDKESRSKRDKQYEEGLRRTGLGDDAPGGADFAGANKVVHPVLTEACVDFAARAMKELFPQGGPVKTAISGKPSDAKLRKAKRKAALLNWQLTVQCKEVRAEVEQMMTQVPLGGAQYLKVSWEKRRNRPNFLFVAIDDVLLPFAATNFYTAQRKTHVQYLTQLDYRDRVKSGMYRDVDLAPASMEPEVSAAGRANDKIEGRSATSYNEDGLRTVYEIYAHIEIEGDSRADGTAPYVITVDKPTGEVLAIYRNWAEDDESQEELQWFVEWPFIPWRGAYPIGLPHLIGGLSAAATGSLRALLDSAHISNTASMVKLKGGQIGGQNIEIKPTQIVELEGGINIDDVRKLAMPVPFNPPSAVLFSLLGFVVDAAKSVVRTSMEDIADTNQNAPVGTTLAKIEQGMVVFSAIHGRLCDAMDRMLDILDRLNGQNLDVEMLEREAGEVLATREDFGGPRDVSPVSDPNIFSEVQRFGQVQAVAQRAALLPQLYDMRKVELRLLQTLKVPDAESLLMPAQTPKELNAVAENAAAALGRPVTAFAEQDHLAHMATHIAFMQSPMFGGQQFIAQSLFPVMLNHLKEHLVFWYAAEVLAQASEAVGRNVGDMLREMETEEDTDHTEEKQLLDRVLAAAAPMVLSEAQQERVLQALPQVVQMAQQLLQQMAQQPPMNDPRIALEGQKVQLQGQKVQQDFQLKQGEMQLRQQELAFRAQEANADNQIAAQEFNAQMEADARRQQLEMAQAAAREDAENQRLVAELEARKQMNAEDNATAMNIAGAEIAAGERSALSTGTGINP